MNFFYTWWWEGIVGVRKMVCFFFRWSVGSVYIIEFSLALVDIYSSTL